MCDNSLYDEYLTGHSEKGREFDKEIMKHIDAIVEIAKKNDLNLREAQQFTIDVVSVSFIEAIVRRGLEIRMAEREKKDG